FAELPAAGTTVSAGQVCGEIESTKSVGELYAPVDGEVVEANTALDDDPSAINADPFGDGWLVKLRVDPGAVAGLLDRVAYLALTGGAE
ncbi:MAG: glycine cleavage system protein H, partial [Microbacterium sp. 70-38]